ncbi:hypothetical protein L596_018708 [Steinernema carpocapsae]|uniref:Translation initiation factor beta propellor-like domain-containing protein n=1 Tax=Steinernema carpocapsae TaxID=34508 RepID=A0A4U5N5F6_STECR|nr:hypothetical protein L596_018708 [Steinernema carpocapsae]
METFRLHRELMQGTRWRRHPLKVTSERLEHLKLSNRHYFGMLRDRGVTAVLSIDIDPAEGKFLLCGGINGSLAVVEMDNGAPSTSTSPQCVTLKVQTAKKGKGHHKYARLHLRKHRQASETLDANGFVVAETFRFEEEVKSVHWSPHGGSTDIAVGLESSNIHFIDIRTGDSAQELRWKDTVNTVQWSPSNANILASGGLSGTISIWDKRSGKSELCNFRPESLETKKGHLHQPAIGGLKFSSDGLYLVAADLCATVHVWATPHYSYLGGQRLNISADESKRFAVNGLLRFDVSTDAGDVWAFVPGGLSVYAMKLVDIDRSNKVGDKIFRLQGSMTTLNACTYRSYYNQVVAVSKDGNAMLFHSRKDEVLEEGEKRRIQQLTEDNWSDED